MRPTTAAECRPDRSLWRGFDVLVWVDVDGHQWFYLLGRFWYVKLANGNFAHAKWVYDSTDGGWE